MLLIDGPLLLGVLLFDPTPVMPAAPARWPVAAAVLLAAVGSAATFWRILPERAPPPPPPPPPEGTNGPTSELPPYWFTSDLEAWKGKPWREIDLFGYLPTKPKRLDEGTRYAVFYGRTCDHCEDMFRVDLVMPALGSITTAIEVPYSKTRLTGPNPWPMVRTECEMLQLPLGCDWIMTTPLTLRIVDGIVECVEEGSHEECMLLR
jgi:hypothetical protein